MAETSTLPPLLTDAGLWIGLLLTLALFSMVLGDSVLARLAQHLLVGAGMGYAAVMAIQYVITMRMLTPLAQGQWATQIAPLLLSLLLIGAAVERMVAQRQPASAASRARRVLQTAGVLPLGLLLGVGISAGLIGIMQGTLLPQAALVITGTLSDGRTGSAFWYGLLTLLLTTATLLALTVGRVPRSEPLPRVLHTLLHGWVWLGDRALWIATGVILARLFASRLTLLVDRLDYLAITLRATGLWQWVATIWQNIVS